MVCQQVVGISPRQTDLRFDVRRWRLAGVKAREQWLRERGLPSRVLVPAGLVEGAQVAVGADEAGGIHDPAVHQLFESALGDGVEDRRGRRACR